ncbi:hypothetical protein LMG9449_1292 [Lactococcus lactis subsp. lactis]|uniref:Uncharacterized protein n=1 Tax=Lactococcus lactis subsp. lactis TaxID=1360 RepID=A0A0V8DYS2_LACLL|nr:hypothetical protein LMG9449_1292 [Lactococcus lactis subsp. lactis]
MSKHQNYSLEVKIEVARLKNEGLHTKEIIQKLIIKNTGLMSNI